MTMMVMMTMTTKMRRKRRMKHLREDNGETQAKRAICKPRQASEKVNQLFFLLTPYAFIMSPFLISRI